MELSTNLVFNRHPILVGDEQHIVANILPGETLGDFLDRNVPEDMGGAWEVIINGQLVPYEVLSNRSIRPKPGARIVVRSIVNKQALYIVSMIALTYFTFGIGGAAAGAAAGGYVATTYGVLAASAVYVAGAVIINKLLGPKPEDMRSQERDTVYSLSGSRNQIRLNEPLPLVFGRVKFAPDIISAPYSYYVGNRQRVGVVFTPGINCGRFSPLYMGETLLTDFDDAVTIYQSGFPLMPDTGIPLYTNADTITGGELNKDRTWVVRNLPPQTQRVMFNIDYMLGDADSKGRPYPNQETVEIQYREVGSPNWVALRTNTYRTKELPGEARRATITATVNPDVTYETRTRILGIAMDGGGSNGRATFSLYNIVAVQKDETDYRGIRRIGLDMEATGKLQGTPDEITGVMWADAIPVWKGDAIGWVTEETSNPGAQILAYCRGVFDDKNQLVGGMGLPDEDIDIEALKAFTLHCSANNYFYDFVLRDTRNHEEVINAIALVGFGQLDSKDGRISVVWAAEDQPNEGVANMATMERGSFSVGYSLANEADGIEYTYYDRDSWELKTLRIPFPGVESILSPSRITGEGVGTEEHAAELARFHAAQQLYQKRDISYSTDLSHMAYRRMSKLSMSHDLTQWGYSGQLLEVSGDVLTLSQTVPPNANGKSYIGVQMPGAANYRVMECVTVGGADSRQVQLVEPWPSDLPLPGGQYTARDYTWVYDFKATPGHSVRVVSIEPEDDLSGARISVVSEGPEYWNYIKTGVYIPPSNDSLLQTRPVASRLTVSERQVVQGDTVFTELIATFDITGPMGRAVVMMPDEDGELQVVAETITRTASWRIPGAGTYQIVVRPFSPDGLPGIAATTIYSTIGTDAPPVLVDLFDVVERSGGVRLYTWGWLTSTMQSADFAGVEIRYIAGNVSAPDWSAMTPVGDDGYHTAPFEAVIPESGQWTFAVRSRNTSGTLSTGMRVVTKTLGANLGEQIGGIGTSIDYITQQQVAQQAAIDAEVFARVQADIAVAEAAGADATAKANAARDQALAGVEALANVVEQIDTRVDGVDGQVGNLASRVGVVEARMPGAAGVLATQASVTDLQTATAAADAALADSITAVQATANGAQSTATQALTASATNASAITQVQAGQAGGGNMLANADFGAGSSGLVLALSQWGGLASGVNWGGAERVPQGGTQFGFTAGNSPQGVVIFDHISEASATEGENWIASARLSTLDARAKVQLLALDANGAVIDYAESGWIEAFAGVAIGSWPLVSARFANGTPPGTTRVRWRWETDRLRGTNPYSWVTQPALAKGAPGQTQPGPWAVGAAGLASATFALKVAQDAQITLTTNVNGHVSGMVSKNDGQRGVISFLADVFEIITSGSVGVRFTRRNGGYFMRFYAASVQTILGINFGASNNLCFWYGPNVGEENCTQANGTIWFNNAGSAYFGGSLSAGVLKNAAQSTQISAAATVDTGPFTTNGGARVVNSSMSYTNAGYTATDQGGTVALSAGVVLERSRDNGATWTQISNFTATGQRIFVEFEPGLGYNYEFSLTGSTTYTDNTGGTANVNYRLRITSSSGPWPFNFGTGPNPLGRQNLAVISVEQ